MEDLNDYELARARLIARNRERMVAMGLLGAASSLMAATKQEASEKPRPRPRPRPQPRAPQAPTRASKRLRGDKAGALSTGSFGKEEEEEEERKEERPSPPPRWTEEELKEIRRDQELKMSERLADLELSGLIDAEPGTAHFAIVGAQHKGQKRKHYRVTLEKKDPGSSKTKSTSAACECVDFRIRRKKYGGHCKHIKLVLAQLGLGSGEGETSSDGWEEALERVVMAKK